MVRWILACGVALALSACHEGGTSSTSTATGTNVQAGQSRTIRLQLKGLYNKVALSLKASSGKSYPAKIDPITGKAILTIPQSVRGVISAKVNNIVKKMVMARVPPGIVFPPGKPDTGLDPVQSYLIPEAFHGEADLGTIDLTGPATSIVIGDDPGERSIWFFVDSDGDGINDQYDGDDDGDGILDGNDGDWEVTIDWFDTADDTAWDDFAADAECDFQAAKECVPAGFFDESQCAVSDQTFEEFCTYPGDDTYVVPVVGATSWFSCYSACASACADDAVCGEACVQSACAPPTAEPTTPSCEPVDCDDQDACTDDACVAGTCENVAKTCDDQDACTDDACVAGTCENVAKTCDDQDACTDDTCVSGACESVAKDCADDDVCTDDVCTDGTCSNPDKDCDDLSECTTDSCDAGGLCVNAPLDDATPCGVDGVCVMGACGTPADLWNAFCAAVCQDDATCNDDCTGLPDGASDCATMCTAFCVDFAGGAQACVDDCNAACPIGSGPDQ